MNEPITVSYLLEEVLKRMDNKLDTIQKDVLDLKVGVATLTEKVESMDKQLEKVEGTQKNQVWALIVLLASAIATAGARLFFISNS